MDALIIGAGIGGLTLGLMLHRRGIACRVFEAAPEIRPLGVGINILPHASRELGELGLEQTLAHVAVLTREAAFFNRFGQLIYREPLGREAGYEWPQYSIHRGDLQAALRDAFCARAGADRLQLGWKCVRAEDGADGATAHFVHGATGEPLPPQRGRVVIGCDGVNSVLRKQFHPHEGEPRYSGVNMWRGVTRWPPMLSGATMVRAGWLDPGKLVMYPIRDRIDARRAAARELARRDRDAALPPEARLGAAGPDRRLHRTVPRLALRLVRRARADPRRGRDLRVSDGRPGPARPLDLRAPHAPRRRRAPDGAARLERCGPGDHRRARARGRARRPARCGGGARGPTRRRAGPPRRRSC